MHGQSICNPESFKISAPQAFVQEELILEGRDDLCYLNRDSGDSVW